MAKLFTKRQRRQLVYAVFALLFAGFVWLGQRQGWLEKPAIVQVQPGYASVKSVVDGDTITVDLNGVTERVRLLGVDTPETQDPRVPVQCYGQAASDFTKQLLNNQTVRLENDPTNDDRDRYDRLLRYVYLPDGRLVNAEIIKAGYGFAYTLFPFQKLDEFRSYENQARQNNSGLWGSCMINQEGDKKTTSPAL